MVECENNFTSKGLEIFFAFKFSRYEIAAILLTSFGGTLWRLIRRVEKYSTSVPVPPFLLIISEAAANTLNAKVRRPTWYKAKYNNDVQKQLRLVV